MINLLSDKCEICGRVVECAIELPKLPLTGIYSRPEQAKQFESFDQELLVCAACGHAQLKYVIDSSYLYGQNYIFRTSVSRTAREGAQFLATYLEKLTPGRTFARIVDFGCNDAYLLKLLKHKGEKLLGVDLIWAGREAEFHDEKISVIGEKIEAIDFERTIGGIPDLIISQHTMEHIAHPKILLKRLFSMADDSTIFLFEFPCLDPLLEQFRFDRVFHQHLQYYSVQSFLSLLEQTGGELLDLTFNHSHWGALLVAFSKTKTKRKGEEQSKVNLDQFPSKQIRGIQARYGIFRNQMEATKFALEELDHQDLYGYGAALMLPVLGYHLQTDFSEFQAIFDDDPQKDGMSYINLPVIIKQPVDFDFSTASICLTALDNRRPILGNLLKNNPKNIINPLNFL